MHFINLFLQIKVLADSKLAERIAEAHKSGNAVGYLGHLRDLANELVRTSKMCEPIGEFLQGKFVFLLILSVTNYLFFFFRTSFLG